MRKLHKENRAKSEELTTTAGDRIKDLFHNWHTYDVTLLLSPKELLVGGEPRMPLDGNEPVLEILHKID